MQDEAALREELVRIGRLMYDRQLIVAAEGNLSARLGGDLFLVTPAGRCKGMLAPADLVTVDGDGRAAEPGGGRATSEWGLHREIYEVRPDARAVCHGHPAWATAFAASGQALDGCLLPEAILTFGRIPLASYATPGTAEVAQSVRGLVARHDAILLANHGVVTLGATPLDAYLRLETVERLAQVSLLARLAGGERRLRAEEMARLPGGGATSEGPPCRLAEPTPERCPEELASLADLLARGILKGLPPRETA